MRVQARNSGLREGGRALSQSRERHRARKALVVVQVALALVLLICSGLMIRTFRALMHVSPGFAAPDAVQTFRFYIPETQIPDAQAERVVRMEEEILKQARRDSGSFFGQLLHRRPDGWARFERCALRAGSCVREGELPPIRRFKFVSPGFFATLGTQMLAGRDLTWTDTYQKRPVAVISENFAREYWHDANGALGKRIRVASTDDWREIVGVVQDVHDDGVDKAAPSRCTGPSCWTVSRAKNRHCGAISRSSFAVRAPARAAFMKEVQERVWSVNPDVPLAEVSTLGDLYTKSMARTSFTLVMLCVAGGMALLLGIVGIYGVISYSVSQRTREIGIRMALGAQRDTLTAMFVRQGLWLTRIGAACGLVIAFVTMRLMSSLLFNVSPVDPITYITITIGVVAVAYLACYLPSRRAATVEPMDALRTE